jgi:hypothetical protein
MLLTPTKGLLETTMKIESALYLIYLSHNQERMKNGQDEASLEYMMAMEDQAVLIF